MQLADFLRYSRGLAVLYNSFIFLCLISKKKRFFSLEDLCNRTYTPQIWKKRLKITKNLYIRFVFLIFLKIFFSSVVGFPLYTEIFYIFSQWSSASESLMPDSNRGPLPQKSGALPISHHISFLLSF